MFQLWFCFLTPEFFFSVILLFKWVYVDFFLISYYLMTMFILKYSVSYKIIKLNLHMISGVLSSRLIIIVHKNKPESFQLLKKVYKVIFKLSSSYYDKYIFKKKNILIDYKYQNPKQKIQQNFIQFQTTY